MTKSITLAELARRDKWICHICGKRVERLSDATREHLIPKVYGGHATADNLALAHSWCNKAKGSRVFMVEQHGTGYVIVGPNREIVSDVYPTYYDALAVVQEMNEAKLYMESEPTKPEDEDITVVRRVQDNPM